ncbi:MAG: VTT domain-containing protein [Myxococcota bacterium]
MNDTLTTWAIEAGPFGLFLLAFLAATLLPFSSEAALLGGIAAGIPTLPAVVACSLGNCLACLVNYGLGAWGRDRAQQRLENSWAGRQALDLSERYGWLALLGSWLPILGDPITIVAGLGRVTLIWFVPLVCGLRVGRYLLLVTLTG